MLWRGQVLFRMMMFDEFRALDYLVSRSEVDVRRLGALGGCYESLVAGGPRSTTKALHGRVLPDRL